MSSAMSSNARLLTLGRAGKIIAGLVFAAFAVYATRKLVRWLGFTRDLSPVVDHTS
jgi:hypothetical protein